MELVELCGESSIKGEITRLVRGRCGVSGVKGESSETSIKRASSEFINHLKYQQKVVNNASIHA